MQKAIDFIENLDERGWYNFGIGVLVAVVLFIFLTQGVFDAVWFFLVVRFGMHVGASGERAKRLDNTEEVV